MPDPSDWIYCRLVDRGTFIFPRQPFWFGQIEFAERGGRCRECDEALGVSRKLFAVAETDDGPWIRLVHARALIPKVSAEEALRAGDFHLTEALQAFNAYLSMGMSELRVSEAGYLFDIRRRRAVPLTPPREGRAFNGISAMFDSIARHPLHALNTLFVAPDAFGELGHAFRRSSHWRELAVGAQDEGEALLLYWMAAECLCKLSRDEVIGPKLLAACGFPTGKIARALDRAVLQQLTAIPNYRSWRGILTNLVDALRVARNQIVHAGYRHVDLPSMLPSGQKDLGMFVLPVAAKCLASMALQSLNLRHKTIAAMWQSYPLVVNPLGIPHHSRWVIDRVSNASSLSP